MTTNQPKPQSSKSTLRRLLVILGIVIGFVIYAYGWRVTDIDLAKPQEAQRQENLQNVLGDLLSPNILDQDTEAVFLRTSFLMGCDEDVKVDVMSQDNAFIEVTPTCGDTGDIITIRVVGFEPSVPGRIGWVPPEGQARPRPILESGREDFLIDSTGGFTGTVEVPRIRDSEGQIHEIVIRADIPTGPIVASDTAQQVFIRMVQTIFMALLATSIAIPIAAFISFFAARNLMRPVEMSVGSLLVAFIAFALGITVGAQLLTPIGTFTTAIASNQPAEAVNFLFGEGNAGGIVLAIIAPIVLIALLIVAIRVLASMRKEEKIKSKVDVRVQQETPKDKLFRVMNVILVAVIVILIVATLGGWAITVSEPLVDIGESIRPQFLVELEIGTEEIHPLNPLEWTQNAIADGIVAIGTLLNIIGTLTALMMPIIAGVTAGFSFASIATTLFASPIREMRGTPNYVLGAILGAIGGALLMAFMATLGMSAALFALLPPFVAAVIGSQILLMIYERLQPNTNPYDVQSRRRVIRTIITIVGLVGVFYLVASFLNIQRALVNDILPSPDNRVEFLGLFSTPEYIFQNMVIGAILGGIGGALAGVTASFPLGTTLYNVSRALLNTIRSIEPLIMGLVFVIWVGIGPFAGVLALTLHSIAALGKLYSEQIENIDPGPIEAIQSTGAGWFQTVIYAVVPQIVPPYIAFTMYRWDINVRMSTIIGFVGGGGIGLLLQQQINLLQYKEAGVAVLAIAVVVSILDYISASIRERLV